MQLIYPNPNLENIDAVNTDLQNTEDLKSDGSNIEQYIGNEVEQPEPKPFTINKVILTPEMLNTARELFPKIKAAQIEKGQSNLFENSGSFIANDLVETMKVDFADNIAEDPNFLTYEGLRNGTATILNLIPEYKDKAPLSRRLSDDDIAKIFSNAEDAPFARAFFGELAKTLPALKVGMETSARVGSFLYSKPIPIPFVQAVEYPVKTALTIASGLVSGYLTYTAADAVEEALLGPDPVIVPGQRAAFEAWRTAGGGAASIRFPFMLKKYNIDSGAQAIIDNLGNSMKTPIGLKVQASLDKVLSDTAKFAATSPGLTFGIEAGATVGSSAAALLYESSSDQPGMGGRLLSEFLGGNAGALTVLKTFPKVLNRFKDAGGVEGITTKVRNSNQERVLNKIDELYQKYGDEEQYELLLNNLTNPDFIDELQEAFPGVDFSIGQQTGDTALSTFEAVRANDSPELSAALKKSQKLAFNATNNFIEMLTDIGTEDALRSAAELRKSLFEETIEKNIALPVNRLLKAINDLQKTPDVDGESVQALSPAAVSAKLKEVLNNQIFSVMKAKERSLYKAAGARDHVVYDLEDGVPDFVEIYDGLSYKNESVQEAFESSVPEIASFIKTIKAQLKAAPVEIDPEDLARINSLQESVSNRPNNRLLEKSLSDLKERFVQENMTLKQQETALRALEDEIYLELKNSPTGTQLTDMGRQYKEFAMSLQDEADLIALKKSTGFVEPTDSEPVVITAGQIDEIRSRALALAREYSSGPYNAKSQFGQKMGEFANSLRVGLENAEDGAPTAYKNAIAFTKAKHDVISRMINQKAATVTRAGGLAVDPEVLFSKYINNDASATLGRTSQLQTLARFADDQELKNYALDAGVDAGVDPVFTTINNLTDSYLRKTQIDEVFDFKFNPVTNKDEPVVNQDKLNKWRSKNKDLLETFPQLDIDTSNAVTFQKSLLFKQSRKKRLDKKALVQQQLGTLLNAQSPQEAILQAFEADYPAQAFSQLFNLRKMTTEAVKSRVNLGPSGPKNLRSEKILKEGLKVEDVNSGFKTAILHAGIRKAGGEVGGPDKTFDPKTFYEFLFKPMGTKGGQVTLADLALKNEVFKPGEMKRLKFMATQMVRMQAADSSGKILSDPDFVNRVGPIWDFYQGIVGSALGSAAYEATKSVLPVQSGTGQLAASSAGVRYIKSIFQSIPATQSMDVLDEILMDPTIIGSFYKKPNGTEVDAERQRMALGNRLKEMLFKRGIEITPYVGRELYQEDDNTINAPYVGFPGLPENNESNKQQYIDRIRRNLPKDDQQGAVVAPKVQPASVNSPTNQMFAASSPFDGAAPQVQPTANNGPVDMQKAQALFGSNDPVFGSGIMSVV